MKLICFVYRLITVYFFIWKKYEYNQSWSLNKICRISVTDRFFHFMLHWYEYRCLGSRESDMGSCVAGTHYTTVGFVVQRNTFQCKNTCRMSKTRQLQVKDSKMYLVFCTEPTSVTSGCNWFSWHSYHYKTQVYLWTTQKFAVLFCSWRFKEENHNS